ncbi:MAG: beta-propeller domain-containing protein, partial [Thermoplasmata archaeon]|nr:beta-propeller domain-containing protein [Thermoplasmata archaeon]
MSLAAAAALCMVLAGIVTLIGKGPEENQTWYSFLNTFSSDEQIRDYFSESDEYAAAGGNYSTLDPRSETDASFDGASSDSYSRTNVQVFGVDEMDVVKTDGAFIYRSTGAGVSIVKAYPPSDLANVSVIECGDFTDADEDMSSFWVSGLFVLPGKLIVVASLSDYYYYLPWYYDWTNDSEPTPVDYHPPRTVVGVFDLSDPADPELDLMVGVSGYPTAARMIDNMVYVIANSYPWSFSSDDVQIPEVWTGNEPEDMDPGKIHYDSEIQDASSFINLLAVNIDSGDFDYESIVSGYTSTVYMTTESLYLTFEKWVGDWSWIENEVATSEPDGPRTTIYRIEIDGLTMIPQAKGEVEGWLLNQFSLDESGSYLRVATTTSWMDPENNVYVLGPDLSTVG